MQAQSTAGSEQPAGRRPRRGATAGARGPRTEARDWRAEILQAAQLEFGAKGYQATSIRAIATRVGVDAKLVHYYFGSKLELFNTALQTAVEKLGVFQVLDQPVPAPGQPWAGTGERYLNLIISALDRPEIGPGYIGLIRTIVTHGELRDYFRAFIERNIVERLKRNLTGDHPEVRAVLVGSQVVGIIMARYIIQAEPLASMPAALIAELAGPTLDRYMHGELGRLGW
ncbi:TetR family transcriptional regulator [Buchananella felis]|uniref:TetR/AcrR family transcriptional regulator n=1 Tax=Buchananella felis TaxID=3231492 RepID=UPI0035274F81